MGVFKVVLALCVGSVLGAGCSSFAAAVDSDDECIESFLTAVETTPELRLPAEGEEAAGTFQSADEWNGETPVCWVNFRQGGLCQSFMYDIDGRWGASEWVPGNVDGSAGCPHDPELPGTAFPVPASG